MRDHYKQHLTFDIDITVTMRMMMTMTIMIMIMILILLFTITAEIHGRLLANFYCQYADRHMN